MPGHVKRYLNLLQEFTICGFKVRDQGSLLGFVWTLLQPMLLLLVLSTLFSRRLSEDITHPSLYLLIGIVHWSFFSTATTKTVSSIAARGDLIRNVRFPREILVFSDIGTVLVSFLGEMVVLFAFVLVAGVPVRSVWLFLPVIIAMQALFIAGVGLILACGRVFIRDVERVWTIALRIGFFCVPIFYTTAILSTSTQRFFFECNPLAQIMAFSRSLLIEGTMPSISWVLYVLVFGCVVFAIGLMLFRRLESRFAETV